MRPNRRTMRYFYVYAKTLKRLPYGYRLEWLVDNAGAALHEQLFEMYDGNRSTRGKFVYQTEEFMQVDNWLRNNFYDYR